nr:sugar transferase [Patulibacter sp. SYSU D01012]
MALGVVPLASVDAAWLAGLADPSLRPRGAALSRLVDVLVSALLLVLLAPLLLLLAVLVAADRSGGVLFRQQRVGRGGRPFTILKLRTMRGTGADWSAPDDPRVTRVGALLRKTHVDELPQLLNVLRGDMSLVGPRPEQVGIATALEDEIPLFPYRHTVRPGITGWARVRCGYARTAEESALKLGNDLFYIKHRSPVLDLAIVLETLRLTLFEKQFEVRAPAAKYVLGPRRPAVVQDFPVDAPAPAERAPVHPAPTVAVG